jgi:hypothetical protein
MQKWMPCPNATCRFGVRVMSKRSGSANCSGSRLAQKRAQRAAQAAAMSADLLTVPAAADGVRLEGGAEPAHHRC